MSISSTKHWILWGAFATLIVVSRAGAVDTYSLVAAGADFDRWMYPFNATPGSRPSASVFGTFGTDSGVDTRHAQFVVGWNTSNSIPAGRGGAAYQIRRARITLTINRGLAWIYDSTQDRFETYLSTNDSRRLPDADPGRPVELFGAGFRHGFSATTFPEDGPFHVGEVVLTNRTVFAVGFDTQGALIDVSNNVGKLDEDAFEVWPFAVGTNATLTVGELAPTDARLYFELDVSNTDIVGYLQTSLSDGALRLVVTSLEAGSFTGVATFAQFFTRENVLADPEDVPVLDLDVELVEPMTHLTGIEWRDDAVTLHFTSTSPATVTLESSEHLGDWTRTTVSLTAGESSWTDPGPYSGARFYRLKNP